jgi:glucose-6-phosphate isomerase
MKIHFDDGNLRAEAVGRQHGYTPAEFDRAKPKALKALKAFRKLSDDGIYGFPHQPFQTETIRDMVRFAESVHGSYDTVVVVGIGGSALGAWALDCALRGPHPVQGAHSEERPRLIILDNVDPSFTQAAMASADPARTLVLVISKAGDAAETVATFLILREWMTQALGNAAARRIIAVTTIGRGDLFALAVREGYTVFGVPANVGGRFSVLTPVGLLPAALIGIDIVKLARGAAKMTHDCWLPDLERNVALRAALSHWLILTRKNKTIQVAFPYSNLLWGTAFWFRQLWAESLGKAFTRADMSKEVNIGQTPVAALGTTDQHSQVQLYMEGPNDKVVTFWAVEKHAWNGNIPARKWKIPAFDTLAGKSLAKLIDAERRATAAALRQRSRPNCTITVGRVDEEHLGAFLQMMEFQTAFMGELLDINAFDQPGVQLGKTLTMALMRGEKAI